MRTAAHSRGFTLTEILVSLAIFGVVSAALLTCYVGLQRGGIFAVNWSESRIGQERVLDSISVDLRNATGVTLGSNGTLPLTLTIPARYAAYESSGFAAGEPDRSSSNAFISRLNSDASGGTITVVYWQKNNTISRTVTGSGINASRVIGDFARTVSVKFKGKTGNLLSSGAVSADTIVPLVITTVPSAAPSLPAISGTMSDVVFLRAKSFKP